MKKLTITLFCVLCASALSLWAGPGHSHGGEKNEAHESTKHEGHSHAAGAAHGSHSEGHKHSHAGEKKTAGPNGGRVIHAEDLHAEFFIKEDRKVQITFLDKAGKAVAPVGQVVAVTTGSRANPLQLTFTEADGVLVSDTALPQGNNLPVVLQIRSAGNTAKPIVERFTANLSQCPTCDYAEYACICEGHG